MFPIHYPTSFARAARFLARILLPLAPLLLLSACYDPDTFKTTAVSPDGRYMALITAEDEVGILDLADGGGLRVLSRSAGEGLAWSPDSKRLVFIDQPANSPSALMIAEAAGGDLTPLARGPAWKGSPAWLGPARIAFLSHDDADRIGIWSIDLPGGAPRPLLQRARDISRLWVSPSGNHLAYQCGGELWCWRPADDRTVRLDPPRAGGLEGGVVFSADGEAAAWCARASERAELIWHDTNSTATLDRLALAQPAGALAITRDGRVAASEDDRVLFWRPRAYWFQPSLSFASWNAVPLQVLGPLGEGGLVYMLNGNIVLAAETARRPAAGRIRSRNVEDLLALAHRLALGGYYKVARDLLDSVQERVTAGSRNEYLVAMAWSQLERMQGRPRSADPWLARAARAAVPGSPEEDAAWLERLALAAIDTHDRPRANWVMSKMPARLDESPLVKWIRSVLEDDTGPSAQTWIQIAAAFRAGDDTTVAHQVYKALEDPFPTALALQGVGLLLGGDLEPLGDVGDYGQRRLEALLGKPEFQIALLSIMRRNLKGGPTPEELSTILLDQWVRQGDFGSARELVRTALRDSSESIPEYLEMMRRFLVIEEIDRWLQRTVTDVLLQKDIADTIAGRLNTPDERLTLRLAQVKKALMDGEADKARQALDQAREMESQAGAADGAEPPFESAQAPFLLRLFQAKIAERERHWAEAAQAYDECTALMERTPGSWEVSPFDVAFMAELLRVGGAADPDLLRTYLETLRGTGDPLINPSHAAATIQVGLSNVATLRRVAPEAWIQPYLTYSEGLSYSLLRDSWRALDLLERARAQNPPPALLQRILLEEAANRDALGQHVIAAHRYRLIVTANVPPPQRAAAIQAMLQAEAAIGSLPNPADRLKDILQRDFLPESWRTWLSEQLGQ